MGKKNKKAKRRGKKYSPAKGATAIAQRELRGYALTYHQGDPLAELWSIDGLFRRTIDQVIVDMFNLVKFKWSIYMVVFCRDQTGEEYMQGQWVHTNEVYKHHELAEFLGKQHKQLLREGNPQHQLNAGWVAIPNGVEISDEKALALLEVRDCWDPLAKWEDK